MHAQYYMDLKLMETLKQEANMILNPRMQPPDSIPATDRNFMTALDFDSRFEKGAITNNVLQDQNVTAEKLAADIITGDLLADGAVTTNKLANEAVTTGKIAGSAVTTVKIAPLAVDDSRISDFNFSKGSGTISGAAFNNGTAGSITINGGTLTNVVINGITGCKAYNSVNLDIPDTTPTKATFDSEEFDTDNMHGTANPSRITINTAGYYNVGYGINFGPNALGKRLAILYRNGTQVYGGITDIPNSGANDVTTLHMNQVFNLSVSDYLEVELTQYSGGSLVMAGGSSNARSYFQALKVG